MVIMRAEWVLKMQCADLGSLNQLRECAAQTVKTKASPKLQLIVFVQVPEKVGFLDSWKKKHPLKSRTNLIIANFLYRSL